MKIDDHFAAYLAALLGGDRPTCTRIVRDLLAAGVPVKALYTDLFGRALYEVGERWQNNRISVATEHLATAITENVMSEVIAPTLFSHEPAGRTLVVSCLANDFHQIGGRMVADIAEMNGWETHFYGANTSLQQLMAAVEEKRPAALALSAAFFVNLPALRSAIEAVRHEHPALPIWLGGQSFRWGGQELAEQFPAVQIFSTLDEFETELNRLPHAHD